MEIVFGPLMQYLSSCLRRILKKNQLVYTKQPILMISHKSSCFCVKEWWKVLATLPSLSFLLMGWMLEEINSFAAFNTCPFVCLSVYLSFLCLLHPVSIFFTNVGLSSLFTRLLLLLVYLFAILSVFMMF